jgi:serine/threonine protein kinase
MDVSVVCCLVVRVAMKSMLKENMILKNQVHHIRAERDILTESENPWIVTLYSSFQDASNLYMVMEFLPGGDLMGMLQKKEIFPEEKTKQYVAEIALAIASVHALGYIHRDLKPDNMYVCTVCGLLPAVCVTLSLCVYTAACWTGTDTSS